MAGGVPGLRALHGSRLLNPSHLLDPVAIKAALGREAHAIGFNAIGIADPTATEGVVERLKTFLDNGSHGDMEWLADNPQRRAHPQVLWSDVRSVIMLGVNYGPDENPLSILEQTTRGAISVYARGDDYHDLIKKRLKMLARWLIAHAGGDVKVFVDTAAVMEKPLAHAAGLGWQGKHTNLVSRDYGSWLFLGAIFTTLDLPRDNDGGSHCGSCSNCLDICPTNAFPAPYRLDARKCISYLTIEHKGPIPHEFRVAMGNRIYGCDDCLAACPWNKFAQEGHEAKLKAREELRAPSLAELSQLDDASFRALFTKSPIKRIGRDRFIRNVLIAIGNSGDATLAGNATQLLADPNPVVRGAAVWALSRLLAPTEFGELAARSNDADATVRSEWQTAAPLPA